MVDLNKVRPSDLWYVIGYIATDGYLSIDRRHINITSKDRNHLYLIRRSLFLKNKVGRKSSGSVLKKKYSQLQLGDVNFYKFLTNLGLTPKKSLTLSKLNIKERYFVDFLRGVIDGDGNISTWVHKTNFHVQWCLRIFSASLEFIDWLQRRIELKFEVKGKLNSRKMKSSSNLLYCLKFGQISASRIIKQVYYENCLSLRRKYLQAQLCLQHRSKVVNYTPKPRCWNR